MPYKSLVPDIDIPNTDLWSLLFERKHLPFPTDKDLFTDSETGRTYKYNDLRKSALGFGKGLKAVWGWKRGDVLGLYTPNNIDVAPVLMGALWAGATVSPANPLYTVEELTFQLKDSGAKALVTQLPFLTIALQAARNAGIPPKRVVLLGDVRDPSGKVRHFTAIRATAYTKRYAQTKIDPHRDLAFLAYSSGTTGLPKGVCLSHRNIVANILQYSLADALYLLPRGGPHGEGDKLLAISPFFHLYGLTCVLLMTVYAGWQSVVMERFEIERACQLIEKYKITVSFVAPPVILAFGKHPAAEKYDLSSLRSLHSGAAPLTRELAEGLWDRLKIPVKQGYGLSETSPVTHTQYENEWARYMGSVGKLLANVEAKIVDPEGNEVPLGEEGELWVKGPNIFIGYLNQPDKTKETMSDDGYFKTGDIFKVDKSGNYYCVDRLKELIKYKGFQVPPAELEGLLLGHEHVLDVAVVGIWDKELATEVPRAYVVLHENQARDASKAAEIIDWAAAKTAPHKKLRGGVHFVDSVPKSASGKILRRVLRDQIKQEERQAGPKL